jgi:hypothetical protein
MTIRQFRSLWKSSPFRPFALCLADGCQVTVYSSDLAMPAPSGRSVVVCQPNDSMTFIELSTVIDIRTFGESP